MSPGWLDLRAVAGYQLRVLRGVGVSWPRATTAQGGVRNAWCQWLGNPARVHGHTVPGHGPGTRAPVAAPLAPPSGGAELPQCRLILN